MKSYLNAILIMAALGLAACQSTSMVGASKAELARNQRVVLAQIVNPTQQADLYFGKDGQYSNEPVAGGYYRKVLGQTASGGWVVQDFYQDSQAKQTDPLVVFHANGLRNFDNDVIDGPVIWYRPDGTLVQNAYYKQGQLHGWINYYDKQGRVRMSVDFVDSEASGNHKSFNEQGRLVMQATVGEANSIKQEYWHNNGQLAIVMHDDDDQIQGWDEQGRDLTQIQASRLLSYLESRFYQFEEEFGE